MQKTGGQMISFLQDHRWKRGMTGMIDVAPGTVFAGIVRGFARRMPIATLTLSFILLSCSSDAASPQQQTSSGTGEWMLVWSDEFDYTGLPDPAKWGYDVGGNGWGNQESQYYTAGRAENARVENGHLIIEARRDFWQGNEYTSARLVTKGKGDWTYGRFEIRAKLPSGRGTWPAIWMLPTQWTYGNGGWPDNGEVDIMEHVGYDPGMIHASTHCHSYYWRTNTQKTATLMVPDAEFTFRLYALEWYPDKIQAFVEDSLYFTSRNEGTGWQVWPFDKQFHLLFNIAVGGQWGGAQGIDNGIFPQRMEVDYVRVYRKK
jgi:beta-glucanase (GH16 family)